MAAFQLQTKARLELCGAVSCICWAKIAYLSYVQRVHAARGERWRMLNLPSQEKNKKPCH